MNIKKDKNEKYTTFEIRVLRLIEEVINLCLKVEEITWIYQKSGYDESV